MKKAFRPRISAGLVLTMALALFSLGLTCLVLVAGNQIRQNLKEDFTVQVYLERGILPHQMRDAFQKISNCPFVARKGGNVPFIQYESKEAAGRRFIKESGEDFMQFLGENPLRDAFYVHLKDNQLHPDSLKLIRRELAQIPGVFEVQYPEDLASSLEKNLKNTTSIILAITLLFMASVYWLLRTSIQSAIHSGRFFIRSMELVGATPWFIRRPYVLAISLGGMLGGMLAALFLGSVCFWVGNQFPETASMLPSSSWLIVSFSLIPAGFLFGFFPALNGIQAYQQKKLEELHQY
jgi:cell division transport system permease protein